MSSSIAATIRARLHHRWWEWARSLNGLRPHGRSPQIVFVLSTGRCGTMTIAELARLAPGVDAYHELSPTLWHTSALAARITLERKNSLQAGDAIRAAFLDARADQIAWSLSRGNTYFESNHRLTFLSNWIAEQYPRSKFVVLTRHPYPYVTSSLRRRHYAGHVLDDVFLRPTPASSAYVAWTSWHAAEKAAWQWATTYEYALEVETTLGSRVTRLASEALFAGDRGAIQGLFDFLGQPVPLLGTGSVLSEKLNRQTGQLDCRVPSEVHGAVRELVRDVASRLGYGLE